jgi:Beta-propeller repeat
MKIYGQMLIIMGHSQSSELSQGFLDIFIATGNKDNPVETMWVRYIGTPSFNEYAYSLTLSPEGNIYALGQIQASGFTNGNTDFLIMSLTLGG